MTDVEYKSLENIHLLCSLITPCLEIPTNEGLVMLRDGERSFFNLQHVHHLQAAEAIFSSRDIIFPVGLTP